ncbi:MAG TPA: DUF6438 domain-containing protein [Pyrinomonadaceae bacterium]
MSPPVFAPLVPPDVNVPMVIIERSDDAFGGGNPYVASIYGDGRVEYKPRGVTSMRDAMEGNRPRPSPTPGYWTITQDQVRQLLDAFSQADFLALRDRYYNEADGCPTSVTDAPSINVTLNLSDKSKKVEHYLGCREVNSGPVYPRALRELEDRIETIALKDHAH